MNTLVWTIGAGGMLGQAVTRAAHRRANWEVFTGEKLIWADNNALERQISGSTRELMVLSSNREMRWSIVWAAGVANTSASDAQLAVELTAFRRILTAVRRETFGHEDRGTLFVASSAGGVYGAALNPPFTELTEPAARSPYGRFKLEQEAVSAEISEAGLPVLIGRITNLYGPGQRLDKMQGLISRLALARLGGAPLSIYVPLETVRDYIYVDDCAALILSALDRLAHQDRDKVSVVTKILGSGQGVSISTLLGYAHALGKKPLRVVLGQSPAAAHQALDLRINSTVWSDLDRFEKTTLPVGFQSTAIDILRELQRR